MSATAISIAHRQPQPRIDPERERHAAGHQREEVVDPDLRARQEVAGQQHRQQVEDRRQPDRLGERHRDRGGDRAERDDQVQRRGGGAPPQGQPGRHEGEHRRADQQRAVIGRIGVGRGEDGGQRDGADAEHQRPGQPQPRRRSRAGVGRGPAERVRDPGLHPGCIGVPALRL
jgi:hypothetical protein